MVDVLSLGKRLRVRATAYVAAEPVPFFWPMRTFIHHNPLFGLEHLPFEQAVRLGARLFHASVFLPRGRYQAWRRDGKVDEAAFERALQREAGAFAAPPGVDWAAWLRALTAASHERSAVEHGAQAQDVVALLQGGGIEPGAPASGQLQDLLAERFGAARPLPECVDALWGTRLADELDELVVKSCLDFFDEDQSSWRMPGRERGLFAAWSDIARRNVRLFVRGLQMRRLLDQVADAESAVVLVMQTLGIDPEDWPEYFTRELTRLHGWTGFIRWRSQAKHYHWARQHPADVVDLLAIRLLIGLALLQESRRDRGTPADRAQLRQMLEQRPASALLREALYSGRVLPGWALRIEQGLAHDDDARDRQLLVEYWPHWRAERARAQADALRELADAAGGARAVQALASLGAGDIAELLRALREFSAREGLLWTEAMESRAIEVLLGGLRVPRDAAPDKRPFAQALFCIDVRSEPYRRNLERIGDYQTFGIAGFFGVPVGFLGYGKGSETHLCPAVVTPRNLVLELPSALHPDNEDFLGTLDHVLHELKSSLLSPYVTVEALGVLFGLDLFGKTMAPLAYSRWRKRLQADRPPTRLLIDKLSREHADSIIRTLQRSLIVKALRSELGIERERVDDELIRELRETALRRRDGATRLRAEFGVAAAREAAFIDTLRDAYRVDPDYANYQMVRLARIGYALEEQVQYVYTALTMIGLTRVFSRFVLVVGHAQSTTNNPYESALDCGACGGGPGLINARVLAQMANKPQVRQRLRERGIDIPDDTWFVPALHTTTTDEVELHDVDLLPPRHLVYLERLRNGLRAASRLAAAERIPRLLAHQPGARPGQAQRIARRMAVDWAQTRPEWGLANNVYAVLGRRELTRASDLEGRSFLLSYDWRCDPRGRLLENLLAAPVVVGQWINLEHFFSTVDNQRFGSGSKVYHNVAGRFGVMTGNLSDLRTGLPMQTVMRAGRPYHEPMRLIALIEAPLDMAARALGSVVKVKNLVYGGLVRAIVLDPTQGYRPYVYEDGRWSERPALAVATAQELAA